MKCVFHEGTDAFKNAVFFPVVQSCYVLCYCDRRGSHIIYIQLLSQHHAQYTQTFHQDLTLCSQKPMLSLTTNSSSVMFEKEYIHLIFPKLLYEFATLKRVV